MSEEMDGIKRYDSLQAALKAFSAADEIEVRDQLQAAGVIGFSESLQISSAFSVVRAFLEKLGEWERRHEAG